MLHVLDVCVNMYMCICKSYLGLRVCVRMCMRACVYCKFIMISYLHVFLNIHRYSSMQTEYSNVDLYIKLPRSSQLVQYSSVMSALLVSLVEGQELKAALTATAGIIHVDMDVHTFKYTYCDMYMFIVIHVKTSALWSRSVMEGWQCVVNVTLELNLKIFFKFNRLQDVQIDVSHLLILHFSILTW